MKKEKFRHDLRCNEWPMSMHQQIFGHSKHLGQFSLLVKKDHFKNTSLTTNDDSGNNETFNNRKVDMNIQTNNTKCYRMHYLDITIFCI